MASDCEQRLICGNCSPRAFLGRNAHIKWRMDRGAFAWVQHPRDPAAREISSSRVGIQVSVTIMNDENGQLCPSPFHRICHHKNQRLSIRSQKKSRALPNTHVISQNHRTAIPLYKAKIIVPRRPVKYENKKIADDEMIARPLA